LCTQRALSTGALSIGSNCSAPDRIVSVTGDKNKQLAFPFNLNRRVSVENRHGDVQKY